MQLSACFGSSFMKFPICKFPTPAHTVLCGRPACLQGIYARIFHSRRLLGICENWVFADLTNLFCLFLHSAPNSPPFAELRHPELPNPLADNGGTGREAEGGVPVPRKCPLLLHGQGGYLQHGRDAAGSPAVGLSN